MKAPRMRRTDGPGRHRLAVAVAAGLAGWLGIGAGHAGAQGYGYGGFGYGLGYNFHYTPPSVSFLNQHSLVTTQAAAASKPQALVAPDDDYGRSRPPALPPFSDKYNVESRKQYLEDRYALRQEGEAPPGPAPAPARRVHPIASFFARDGKLVWPVDAPTYNDLEPKRAAADKAALEVLNETANGQAASVAAVTDARNKLLDYGRPALAYARTRESAQAADALHGFLLTLYDSLGRSATARVARN